MLCVNRNKSEVFTVNKTGAQNWFLCISAISFSNGGMSQLHVNETTTSGV